MNIATMYYMVPQNFFLSLRGHGVPWDRFMKNELEYLSDIGSHGNCGHLARKFLKKYFSYPELSRLPCRDLAVVTRRWQAITNKRDYLKTTLLAFN